MAAACVERSVESIIAILLNILEGTYMLTKRRAIKPHTTAFVDKKDDLAVLLKGFIINWLCCYVTHFVAMIGCSSIQLRPESFWSAPIEKRLLNIEN